MSATNKDSTPDGAKPSNRAAEMAEEARKKQGHAPDKALADTLLGDEKSGGLAGQGGMGGPAS
jgi:hypothetical protein